MVHNLQPSTQYSFVEAACTTAGCQTGGVANVTIRIRYVCGPCVCVCVCVCVCCVCVVCVCMRVCLHVCVWMFVLQVHVHVYEFGVVAAFACMCAMCT